MRQSWRRGRSAGASREAWHAWEDGSDREAGAGETDNTDGRSVAMRAPNASGCPLLAAGFCFCCAASPFAKADIPQGYPPLRPRGQCVSPLPPPGAVHVLSTFHCQPLSSWLCSLRHVLSSVPLRPLTFPPSNDRFFLPPSQYLPEYCQRAQADFPVLSVAFDGSLPVRGLFCRSRSHSHCHLSAPVLSRQRESLGRACPASSRCRCPVHRTSVHSLPIPASSYVLRAAVSWRLCPPAVSYFCQEFHSS
ncbi:hypothetical protein C8Q70DRAFT_193157 [Cubamyces menziesii]|nr:hypothetical protein C8Q70DRAFT_193157 [Cubamyces menziesii]